jgi:Lrp/AsnC family transcriptional regulator, regulator for asnA, asnC and gidA
MRGARLHGLKPATLDEVDRELVRLLQEDGRRSLSEMAREVGLSHASVRTRINRLLDEQIVTITAVTHPGTHGYTQSATIAVRTDHRLARVSESVAAIAEVYYLVTVTGEYDLLVELMAKDTEHLQELVMQLRAIPGVVSTTTLPFVKTLKWVYSPDFI